jgi:transcriptional regulator
MYTPAHFREERLDILHAAIARIGLATLVTHGDAGLEASQLPMIVDPAAAPLGVLSGHMARANPLWKRAGSEALAVFLGPHAYISPSWYPSKAETGKVVPTWNYLAVHATGTIEFFDDPAQLRAQVEQLPTPMKRDASRFGRLAMRPMPISPNCCAPLSASASPSPGWKGSGR